MSAHSFDLVVIGGGPGGYVAALRAAQLGLRTALVESSPHLGGTCLNVGCIPSKALLHSTELFHTLQTRGREHGILVKGLAPDIAALMARKDAVVTRLRAGIRQLVEQRGITLFQGKGSLESPHTVLVSGPAGTQNLQAAHMILATGSQTLELPFMPFDGKTVVSSDEAIAFERVPETLTVVGAGAIGLELGSVWARLGARVTIVELLPRIAPSYDEDVSRMAERLLKKQGLRFELGAKVTGIRQDGGKTFLMAEKNKESLEIASEKILVAIGRKPNTAGLGLEKVPLACDEKGRIKTDAHLRTSLSHILAIGDVTAGPMLAHKAEEEGLAAAERIAGKPAHVASDTLPNVIYTAPEMASVGIGELTAKERGLAVNIGKFALAANGRAIASDATEGFVKVIACRKTDRLLGVQILAHNASELIAAAVTHMEYGGSAEDLALTVCAHPTLSESLKEAALLSLGRGLHAL